MGHILSQSPEEMPALFGRYRLLKALGKGGMGSVYLAHDTQLDRSVALKIPLLEAVAGSLVLARFYTEARAAAALHHPNICPIYDFGEVEGTPYLTMAYIEGKALREYSRQRPLSARQSAVVVRKLALALHEAHRHGVVHRDLKPGNIMIDKRGEPIIMDFGLARRVRKDETRLTQEGATLGTPAYMPPEQVKGDIDAMGPASDIYSLGVILYELLAGRLPFTGDAIAMLAQVLLETPPPPSRFCPGLDPALEAACLTAMAKRIEERHGSMAELAAALSACLKSHKAATPVERTRDGRETRSEDAVSTPSTRTPRENATTRSGDDRVGEKSAQVRPAKKRDSTIPRKRRQTRSRRVAPLLALAAGAAVLILIAGIFFHSSDVGTIQIDVEPPTAQVEIQVDGVPGQKAGVELRLPVGTHHLLVIGGDFENEQKSFSIERGHNPDLKISLRSRKRLASASTLAPPPDAEKNALPKENKSEIAPTFKNAIGMEFARVPGGKFWIGGGSGRPGDTAVEIHYDFYLGKYEVTQEEWQKVMGTNPSEFQEVTGISSDEQKRFPVENISWNDAQLFVKRLNSLQSAEGWRYSLPREAEWEYACRGGPMADQRESAFDFGLDTPANRLLHDQANFDQALKRTCKVGSFRPNALGLYDMHGNVWEWCESAVGDGIGAPPWIVRGGSWMENAGLCRAACRNDVFAPFDWSRHIGMRVARVPTGKKPNPDPLTLPSKDFTDPVGYALATCGRSPIAADRPESPGTDDDAAAVDWVLGTGGFVSLVSNEGGVPVQIFPHFYGGFLMTSDDGAVRKDVKTLADVKNTFSPRSFALRHINLWGRKVSDKDLRRLKNLKSLKTLNLAHTSVTNVGLEQLRGLAGLSILRLNNTAVNATGVRRLQAALPNCLITLEPVISYQKLAAGPWTPALDKEEDVRGKLGVRFLTGTLEFTASQNVFIRSARGRDVAIRARVKKMKIGGQNLLLRLRCTSSSWGYIVYFDGGKVFGFGQTKPTFQNYAGTATPKDNSDFFEFVFAAKDSTLAVFVDGKQIMEYRDPSPDRGDAAIGAFRGGALFQQVEVQELR